MLSPTAPIYGNLAGATGRALAGLQRSVSKALKGSGTEKVLQDGDGGQHVYASRLGSEVRSKQAQISSLQNAISFSQSQRSALTIAISIFDRMGELAVQASDPVLSSSDRNNLDLQFNQLRELTDTLGKDQFNGRKLYRRTYLKEDFDGLALNPFVSDTEELVLPGDGTDWTSSPPNDWTMNKSAAHGTGGGTPIPEFDGWTFLDPQSWQNTAAETVGDGGQNRNLFTKGKGVVAVADSDEFDDDGYAGIRLDASLKSPSFDISGVDANGILLKYDSSWRHFSSSHLGKVLVSFDGGAPTLLKQLDLNTQDSYDESVELDVNNPAGASSMQVSWDYSGKNDYWWAIDNIEVTEPKQQVFVDDRFVDLENVEVPQLPDSISMNLLTEEDAVAAASTLASFVQNLGEQKAFLGSNLSRLQLSVDRLNNQVIAGQASLDRMTDEEMADDLIRVSRDKIVSEGSIALMTQARGINRGLVNTVLM